MATTKSTVLGVRLDHERRAWIETAAAEQGLTVRGLVERMIDEAREAEAAGREPVLSFLRKDPRPAAGSPPPSGSPPRGSPPNGLPANGAPPTERSGPAGRPAGEPPPLGGGQAATRATARDPESPCAELAHMVSLSGQMACGAARLATAVVKTAGSCAFTPWRALHAGRVEGR